MTNGFPKTDRLPVVHDQSGTLRNGLRANPRAAALLALVVVGFVLAKAWVSDDAFITFRHVDNLLAGYGPVFNPGERVQGFTHPLWFGLLAIGGLITTPYTVAIALGVLCTLALFAVQAWLMRGERNRFMQLQFLVLILLSSKTFVEFQTSGLETSLSNVLIASLWALVTRAALAGRTPPTGPAAWLCGLIILNRPDHVFLVAPLAAGLVWCAARTAKHRWAGLLSAAIPIFGWYGFATIYYGSPIPNTGYAKLNLPTHTSIPMGLQYLWDYILHEPVHALVILAAIGLGSRFTMTRRPGSLVLSCLVAGIAFHVAYIIGIGGDFMRGRFIDPVLTASAVLVTWLAGSVVPEVGAARWAALATGLVGAGIFAAQLASWTAIRCVGYGIEKLQYAAGASPGKISLTLLAFAFAVVIVMRRTQHEAGSKAAVLFAVFFTFLGVLMIGLIGYRDTGWVAACILTAAIPAIAAAGALGIAGSGWRSAASGMATCIIIAAAGSLCDIERRSETGAGVISDDYSFYRLPDYHNPFRHAVEALHGSTAAWRRLGLAARQYAERFGPITLACESLGITSYYAGPRVHVIDMYGLTEPYLARGDAPPSGKPGHAHFRIPIGYLETRGAINLLPNWYARLKQMDPTLIADAAHLRNQATWDNESDRLRWDQTRRVVTGPLLSRDRLRALRDFIRPQRHSLTDEGPSEEYRWRVSPRSSSNW